MGGGSALPRKLFEGYRDVFGVPLVQGWGMTETSPVCTIGNPPSDLGDKDEIDWRVFAGRIMPGAPLRVTADLRGGGPRDGESPGEIEGKGPWDTTGYS